MKTFEILSKYFDKKKRSQSGYSLRVLAKQVDRSPSFLSRVLSGKKPLPLPLLKNLGSALDIEAEVFSQIIQAHARTHEISEKGLGRAEVASALEDWHLVESRQFKILGEWFFLPILEITTLKGFDGRVETIARRLGISPESTKIAVQELLALGLLIEKQGRIVKARKNFRWGSAKTLPTVRRHHSEMMKKAQHLLVAETSEEAFSRRLITGITLTASAEKIEAAKQKLIEALHEIANELIASPGDEVYQLSAQFFPLTKKTTV